jgi:hypothetical protein
MNPGVHAEEIEGDQRVVVIPGRIRRMTLAVQAEEIEGDH